MTREELLKRRQQLAAGLDKLAAQIDDLNQKAAWNRGAILEIDYWLEEMEKRLQQRIVEPPVKSPLVDEWTRN